VKPEVRKLLDGALERHRAGALDEAERLYRAILDRDPGCADAWHLLGLIEHQRGRPSEAVARIERAVSLSPRFAAAWSNLGRALRAEGRQEEALDAFRRALELDPGLAEARFNLATALHDRGAFEEASDHYRQAIERRPELPQGREQLSDALARRADQLRGEERLDEAAPLLEEAIERHPENDRARVSLAYCRLGRGGTVEALALLDEVERRRPDDLNALLCRAFVLRQRGDRAAAADVVRRIVAKDPQLAVAHDLLGDLLAEESQVEAALAARRRAVELSPGSVDPRRHLGDLLQAFGRLDEAERIYDEALAIDPEAWTVHNSLGSLHVRRGEAREALQAFRKALVPEPRVEPLSNLGVLLRRLGRLEEGAKPLRLALKLDPDNAHVANNLAVIEADQGRLHEAERRLIDVLERDPTYAVAHSNLVYFQNFRDDVDPRRLFEAHLEWGRRHADPLGALPARPAAGEDPERRLRVGYISPDFRKHSVSYFFAPVLEAHDRERFEVFCYADVAQPDAVTQRLQQASDGWLRVTGLRPDAVARRIREDGVDILVDLAGHTGDNPLLVLAHRPAPVQVSWLGYPNTTGMRAVDYRLADPVVEPYGVADELSTERIVRLSHGFHCYEPPPDAPEAAPLPATREGCVTFGSFNDLKKTQPAVIRAWAEILNRVPGSRLWLKCSSFVDATTRERYATAFAEAGLDPVRVRMIPRVASTEEHLGLYGRIDVGLDPFPYNGTTTTCEALWMGVPVVTLRGDRHAGRVGASLLGRVGLEAWIADTRAEYVELAVSWASRLDELAALRRGLRERVARSPLRDGEGLTRAIEEAYRTMWRDACARPR
jgi:predicted O-linked N-acetylglucosamine transferase (SPINDLY family)